MNQHISKSMGRQQGFTLVELGISMVLIASMVLAGFYVVKRIRTDAAINAAIASATVSMNQANAAYAGMEKTTGAKVDILAAMNVWPKERFITTETKSGTAVIKTEVTSNANSPTFPSHCTNHIQAPTINTSSKQHVKYRQQTHNIHPEQHDINQQRYQQLPPHGNRHNHQHEPLPCLST